MQYFIIIKIFFYLKYLFSFSYHLIQMNWNIFHLSFPKLSASACSEIMTQSTVHSWTSKKEEINQHQHQQANDNVLTTETHIYSYICTNVCTSASSHKTVVFPLKNRAKPNASGKFKWAEAKVLIQNYTYIHTYVNMYSKRRRGLHRQWTEQPHNETPKMADGVKFSNKKTRAESVWTLAIVLASKLLSV